jgi:translation initiation factor 2D
LTKKECNALIESYIDREELKDTKGRVLVNGPLCDAIYRASKKNKTSAEAQEYPTSVKRKELVEMFFSKMDKGHALVEMPGSVIVKIGRGPPPSVDIEVENRQGNKKKFLTRIRGMEEYGLDGESLSNDVSHRFACSASVESNPVGRPALKKNRVELVFQGRLDVELTALLTGDEKISTHGGAKNADYNLPKSVINVVLRKGIPAKKK